MEFVASRRSAALQTSVSACGPFLCRGQIPMPLRLVRYGRPSFVDKDEANVGAQGNSGRAEESPDPTFLPSGPGEFHPESLTDPDVILSHHPARVIARRLPPSAEPSGSSQFDPVGPCSTAMTCPLCSTGITPLHNYYEAVRPSPAHRYFGPRGWSRLRLFP